MVAGDLDVVGAHRLSGGVVEVEGPPAGGDLEGNGVLPARELAQFGRHDLDDEAAAGLQVSRSVTEAGHLGVLRRQIHDRVEDQVGEGEAARHHRGREVADRHADRIAARLRASGE
jgi:hypothetical protein